MLNMGELFRFPRIPVVPMSRVSIDFQDEERYLLRPGDLMFARRSLTLEGAGRCSIVHRVGESTTWEGSIIRARMNSLFAVPEYYFYYFASPQGRRRIETIVEQVAAAGIRSSDLRDLQVPCPPIATQRAIADVLRALDDKIAADQRVIGSADELACAQFEAVACEQRIPLSSIARFVNGKAFTKDATGTGRVVVRIAELNSGIGGSTVYNDIDVPEVHLARPGDLLFAWSGSLTVARWYRPEAIVNQHIFKVIPNDGVPMWLVNQAVRSKLEEYKAIAADKATTMGHIQRRHLDEPVAVPSANDTERIDDLMTSLWDVALAAEVASLKAAQTRDELLPLLMSGKIRVRDAERQAEDVL